MKIRFCFYKAKIDGKFLDNAIAAWTGLFPCNWGTPPYSHVEVWFPNLISGENGDEFGSFGRGLLWSSSTRGRKWPGVRCGFPSEILKHPERWDILEFDGLDEREVKKAALWCHSQIHKSYDFAGIFGFFWPWPWPWNTQKDDDWYCSTFGAKVAWLLRLTSKLWKRISPRRLWRKLEQSFGHQGITMHWDKDSKTWK